MILLVPATLIAALIAPLQAEPDDSRASAIVPFVGDEVAAVLHVDLTGLDLDTLARRVLAGFMNAREIDDATRGLSSWLESLREAGADSLALLVDPAELPGPPTVLVTLAEGADAEAIGRILCGDVEGEGTPFFSWPTCATVRGALFAGSDAALERVRQPNPSPRADVVAAFDASGDASARLLIVPSTSQRRVFEEMLPTLPEQLGSRPLSPLTRGMQWAAVAVEDGPNPGLRVVVQASDHASARELDQLARIALGHVGEAFRDDDAMRAFVEDLDRIEIKVSEDRIVLAVDLEQASALVGAPLRRAREAARRSKCINNMKQIGLAMHNYHSREQSFPPAYTADAEGKPLLSWRVLILPYLEQKSLYDEFHLDEHWDSPHNAALIPRMPEVYRCPSASPGEAGTTTYLVPRGEATIFPGPRGIALKEILDGTSNTLLVVDAGASNAVSWTKPDDWEVGDMADPSTLLGNHPGGFLGSFADGSVRFFGEAITPDLLRWLTTISGGETIDSNDL